MDDVTVTHPSAVNDVEDYNRQVSELESEMQEPTAPSLKSGGNKKEGWISSGHGGQPAWAVNDVDTIKAKVREKLLGAEKYSVFNFYHETGVIQKIAKSMIFDNITLGVIMLNAVWIAIDTDWNTEEILMQADPVFIVAENLFCLYFSIEWTIRFLAFKGKLNGLKDAWFVFDSVLVFFMVMETWVFLIIFPNGKSPFGDNTAILRLFRLLRLSRLVKLLKSLPELMILIKGMITAMQSVVYVMLLLVALTYVFAIACTQLSMDAPGIHEQYFDHVALSMYSLIVYATFLDDLSGFCDTIRAESVPVLIIVIIFICLSALTVMNMLIGVLCEVIASVAETEKETLLTEQVISEMKGFMSKLDVDNNGTISFEEMQQILMMPEALQALENVGVDPLGMIDFAETFFSDEQGQAIEITFEKFMEMVLDLRSSNTATVKDIMNLGKQINLKLTSREKAMESAMLAQQRAMEATVTRAVQRLEDELKATTTRIEERLSWIPRS